MPVCPLVSIGMPAFNCERTLALAIRSLLSQSYENWELLVMEDGSSDQTLEVARSFSDPRISVLFDRSHQGLVPRLNQAVEMSHGKYFARMDADDVAYPERFSHQVDYLERHPEVDLLGCAMLVFRDGGRAQGCRIGPQTHEEICQRPTDGFAIGHPTWMGLTEWFRVHPYDPKAIRSEDQVLLLHTFASSRFACLPEILCGYRESELALRNMLRGRYGFAKAAFVECIRKRQYTVAISSALRQCGKALLDTTAALTGLGYAVLPHRARPLNEVMQYQWVEVWSQLNQ